MNNRLIGLFALIALIAIVPPTMWQDHSEDRWAKWIYDYQPLIAGAFAIFAAYLTISTMRETDDRQELRHQELMRLNLKRDQLIARRAAHPQILELQDSREDIVGLTELFREVDYIDWITSMVGDPQCNQFSLLVSGLEDILQRDQFDAVKPLLDQSGYRALQIVRKELEILRTLSAEVTNDIASWENGNGYTPFTHEAERRQFSIQQSLRIMHQHIASLNESIVALAGEYE